MWASVELVHSAEDSLGLIIYPVSVFRGHLKKQCKVMENFSDLASKVNATRTSLIEIV